MRFQAFTAGSLAENGYVVWCEATGQCVVVDPGAGAPLDLKSTAPKMEVFGYRKRKFEKNIPARE